MKVEELEISSDQVAQVVEHLSRTQDRNNFGKTLSGTNLWLADIKTKDIDSYLIGQGK
jgi:hypothetical protein